MDNFSSARVLRNKSQTCSTSGGACIRGEEVSVALYGTTKTRFHHKFLFYSLFPTRLHKFCCCCLLLLILLSSTCKQHSRAIPHSIQLKRKQALSHSCIVASENDGITQRQVFIIIVVVVHIYKEVKWNLIAYLPPRVHVSDFFII
jgi:hypothetical protein